MKSGLQLPSFLSGGGELGQRIREMDWASTPLGPVHTWSQGLRTCVGIMLTSSQPIWIGWGKDLIKLYNDPYKAIVGGKDAWALGTSASIVWKEIWHEIGPMLDKVMTRNEGTYVESALLIMERNGYPEETYYTFSYTPVQGEDGVAEGMICANSDDTDRIIGERQLKTLTQLGKSLTTAESNIDVVTRTINVLKNNPYDFPFALFYKLEGDKAVFEHATDMGEAAHLAPSVIDLNDDHERAFALRAAINTGSWIVRDNVRQRVGNMPTGAWEISPDKAVVMPISLPHSKEIFGFLVVGINPYRLLNEKYNNFLSLIADQMEISFANVHVLEEERKRAEALAEIDRLKTAFFSNISHEFRTPLTLLLGPLEEAITDPHTLPQNQARLELAYRNAQRMQKLVNTLLEFSRIEAGRVEGRFSLTDIVSFTEDLASTFRSAIEKAGMQLHFQHDDINGEIYVDVEMWEKIILNLISNAFKYSKRGSITVAISQAGDQVQVAVTDTGIGIPEDQLEQIFNRFHRIESAEGRSQEGTGIGLAMVKELVKMHHGAIQVVSEVGNGSTFTVSIPIGKAHLPQDKIVEPIRHNMVSGQSLAFVEEAMTWNNVAPEVESGVQLSNTGEEHTVLLADDNADMRDYIHRLLSPYYTVKTVTNGEEAWEAARRYRPDLIISDVMMPKLDGFGLLEKVRSNIHTRNIPLLFLSARAGEEAKVEGLQAGADDYLVKPFSSKELLARVDANIRIAKNRMEAEQNLRLLADSMPQIVWTARPDGYIDYYNQRWYDFTGFPERYGDESWIPALHPDDIKICHDTWYHSVHTGTNFEIEYRFKDRFHGGYRWYLGKAVPMRDRNGNIIKWYGSCTDIDDQKRFSEKLEQLVQSRTEELQRSNDDLLQFAHVASHDLKEPVRKVKTFSLRLQDDYGEQIPERGRSYLQKVMNATDRMFAMIEGVLAYSSLSATAQHITPVDLNDIIGNIQSDLEVLIQQKNAVITSGRLPVIEGTAVLLYQLFYNILLNSLKFARSGQPAVINISAEVENDKVKIVVADNGIGFDDQHAQSIFNAFSRLHSKDSYEGTGLGLALCKKIVERHKGTISAHGVKDEGAVFTIVLPLSAQ